MTVQAAASSPGSVVGRGDERTAVSALLAGGARLVTLTGPGGTGKTTLARTVLDALATTYEDGAQLVELAAVQDPALVPAAIARGLDLAEKGAQSAEELLRGHLAERNLLLCLDNLEHLLDATPLVSRLLDAAPGLAVLATSRAPLRLRDEHEYPVPPLSVADAEELLRRRARQVGARSEIDSDPALAEICARLDGLPLAIELAAARLRTLTPAKLLERLDARLPLLTGGARDAPERQRTLRATIEWSHDLLAPDEQAAFARLSVFAGGCTLEAAEAVCDVDLDTIETLVEQSLVRQAAGPLDEPRYTMLETIRELAAEKLRERGEEDEWHRHHAAFFAALASTGEPAFYGADEVDWFDRIDAELPNMRAALDYFIASDDADAALQLASSLFRLWESRRPLEGLDSLESALELGGSASPRGSALLAAGILRFFRGDMTAAVAQLEEACELFRRLGDPERLVLALGRLSWPMLEQGDSARAGLLAREALELLPAIQTPWVAAEARNYAGTALTETGDPELGRAVLEESLEGWRALGSRHRTADALNNLGWVLLVAGDLVEARARQEENLALARESRDEFRVSLALGNLGLIAALEGDADRASVALAENLPLIARRADRRLGGEALVVASAVAAQRSDPLLTARMLGASETLNRERGADWVGPERTLLDRYVWPCRDAEPEVFDAAQASGRALAFEEAIAELIGTMEPGTRPAVAAAALPALGEALAAYVLEDELGRGGMGVVYRAHQASLDRPVALKVLGAELAASPEFRERFLREAWAAAQVQHPHVLPVYEAGEDGGTLFLAMRLVDGADLGSLLAHEGRLDPRRAVSLVSQVAGALDAAHARGLVHRDVKPSNVLVEQTGSSEHAWLADFGLARAGEVAGLTKTGTVLGSLDYLAPEQITGGESGPAVDVYALACTLFELLTGHVPYPRESEPAKLWAHVQEPVPSLPDDPALARLDEVVRRGLAKSPQDRYESAAALARAAQHALDGLPSA